MAISVGEGGKTIPRPSGEGCYGEFMWVGVEGGDHGTKAVYLPDPEMEPSFPALQSASLPSKPPGKPCVWQALLEPHCKKSFRVQVDTIFAVSHRGNCILTWGVFTHLVNLWDSYV